MFPVGVWNTIVMARQSLDAENVRKRIGTDILHLSWHTTKEACLVAVSQLFLSLTFTRDVPLELLYAFIVHSVLLEGMSIKDRARPLEPLHSELNDILLQCFLPKMFFATESAMTSSDTCLDVDGRVFLSLVRFMIVSISRPMSDIIGSSVCARVEKIWSSIDSPPLDFVKFATRFPVPSFSTSSLVAREALPFRLLPFDNEVFNTELSSIHVPDQYHDDRIEDSSPVHLVFGGGTVFSDSQHWHNNRKAILPSHLGGADPKPRDERQRRRALKGDQRFMATLQRQAGTLTGALGASLQQIIIPPLRSQGSIVKVS